MKTKSILTLLALLPVLFSCQSEALEVAQEGSDTKKEFRIRAYIDSPAESRAAIVYDNDDKEREIFTWLKSCSSYDGDYLTLFNLTKFSEYHLRHNAPFMFIDTIRGKQAGFHFDPESAQDIANEELFRNLMEPGDIILAVVSEAHAVDFSEDLENFKPGTTNVISYQAGSYLYDQKIVENPTTETAMKHVHMMMHLYDVVKVDENGNVPDLHFKHLSSIFRVTLHNKTGKPMFSSPSEIVFTTDAKKSAVSSPIVYGFNYFSVDGNESDGFYLKENFRGTPKRHPLNPTKPDTTVMLIHKAVHKINEKGGRTLNDGEKYDFYAVVTPRIGSPEIQPDTIKKLIIDVFSNGVESGYYANYDVDRYTITIDNFNSVIEPGKRYWFNLTATDEKIEVDVNEYDDNDNVTSTTKKDAYKLVFTSQYQPRK